MAQVFNEKSLERIIGTPLSTDASLDGYDSSSKGWRQGDGYGSGTFDLSTTPIHIPLRAGLTYRFLTDKDSRFEMIAVGRPAVAGSTSGVYLMSYVVEYFIPQENRNTLTIRTVSGTGSFNLVVMYPANRQRGRV